MAANYAVELRSEDGVEIVRLVDAANKTEVSIAVSIGNMAYDMQVNGKPVFWSPYKQVSEFKARPIMLGNPFLAPWANRIEPDGFQFGGEFHPVNKELKNLRRDGNGLPIHGLVTFTNRWKHVEVAATAEGARATARLDVYRYPDWMTHFPWAHRIEMTHTLRDGQLEIRTRIENIAQSEMPVSIGFHPYFNITDAPRDEWVVTLPARNQVVLSPKLVPTGERVPNPHSQPTPLKGLTLDHVFDGIEGSRTFSVAGKQQKIEVVYGPRYRVAVVYAPAGRGSFICFEPMAGVTNAINLAAAGKYPDLQVILPGGIWEESFWIKPSGF